MFTILMSEERVVDWRDERSPTPSLKKTILVTPATSVEVPAGREGNF